MFTIIIVFRLITPLTLLIMLSQASKIGWSYFGQYGSYLGQYRGIGVLKAQVDFNVLYFYYYYRLSLDYTFNVTNYATTGFEMWLLILGPMVNLESRKNNLMLICYIVTIIIVFCWITLLK